MLITIVIALGFFIGFTAFLYFEEDFGILGSLGASFGMTLIVDLLPLLTTMLLSPGISPYNMSLYEYDVEEEELFALNDGLSINGHFFLGTGYVSGNRKYIYMCKTDNGYLKQDSVSIDKAYIKYIEPKEQPKVIIYRAKKFKNVKQAWFSWPNGYFYELRIPQGSIKEDYVIDLE